MLAPDTACDRPSQTPIADWYADPSHCETREKCGIGNAHDTPVAVDAQKPNTSAHSASHDLRRSERRARRVDDTPTHPPHTTAPAPRPSTYRTTGMHVH